MTNTLSRVLQAMMIGARTLSVVDVGLYEELQLFGRGRPGEDKPLAHLLLRIYTQTQQI